MLNNKNYSPAQEQTLKQAVGKHVEEVTNLLGKRPSFREYITNHVFELLGTTKEEFKPNFHGYMKGWELNGYEADDYTSIYNEMFYPTRESTQNAHSLIQQMYGEDDSAEEKKNIKSTQKVTRISYGKMLLIGLIISSIITLTCCCIYRNEIVTFLLNWFTVYLMVIILNIIHCVEVRRHWEKFDITEQYFSIPIVSVALTFLVYLYLGFFLALSKLIM